MFTKCFPRIPSAREKSRKSQRDHCGLADGHVSHRIASWSAWVGCTTSHQHKRRRVRNARGCAERGASRRTGKNETMTTLSFRTVLCFCSVLLLPVSSLTRISLPARHNRSQLLVLVRGWSQSPAFPINLYLKMVDVVGFGTTFWNDFVLIYI